MSAIVRLKRHLNEEPLDVLLLNCKRRKTEGQVPEENSTFLSFAGTLENENDDIYTHLQNRNKSLLEESYKKHTPNNIRDKIREQKELASKNERFKVVTLKRSDNADESFTIVDVESTNVSNGKDFVYDIYYTSSDGFDSIDEQELISVYPLSDELVFGPNGDDDAFDSATDSEDSNAENNWRNDYPEEDESITEDDMIKAMNDLELREDNCLSTDDEREGFIYSIDSEAAGFEEDIDVSDVNRYGERYARFKAKYKNTTRDSDDEDDDGLKGYDYDSADNEEESNAVYYD